MMGSIITLHMTIINTLIQQWVTDWLLLWTDHLIDIHTDDDNDDGARTSRISLRRGDNERFRNGDNARLFDDITLVADDAPIVVDDDNNDNGGDRERARPKERPLDDAALDNDTDDDDGADAYDERRGDALL